LSGKDRSGQNEKDSELALQAFRALGLVVLRRVDVLLSCRDRFRARSEHDPRLTETSLLPKRGACVRNHYSIFAFVSSNVAREKGARWTMRPTARTRARNRRLSSFRQRRQHTCSTLKVPPRRRVPAPHRPTALVFSKIALVILLAGGIYVGARVAAKRFFIDQPGTSKLSNDAECSCFM